MSKFILNIYICMITVILGMWCGFPIWFYFWARNEKIWEEVFWCFYHQWRPKMHFLLVHQISRLIGYNFFSSPQNFQKVTKTDIMINCRANSVTRILWRDLTVCQRHNYKSKKSDHSGFNWTYKYKLGRNNKNTLADLDSLVTIDSHLPKWVVKVCF